MLLKTLTSQPFLYRLPGNIPHSGSGGYHPALLTPPRIYGEEYDGGGVTAIFLNQEPLADGYEVIYMFIQQNMVWFPGYNYALYRFNSTTGEYLGRLEANPSLMVFAKFAQALDGTVYRCDVGFAVPGGVYKCQVDPVNGVTSDGVLLYNLLTFAGITSLDAFNIDTANNIALICANVANQLRVHDLTSGALIRTVTLPTNAVQIMQVSNGKCYVMAANHVMMLIDYTTGDVLSAFQVQDTFDAGLPGVTVAWDAKYNRFLSWVYTPVDTTGQNTSVISGYFPMPQPIGLTNPIPIKPPRKYRTTPVLTRLFGDMGEAVGGVKISLASSDLTVATVTGFPAITDNDGEALGYITDVGEGSVTITATTAIVGPPVGPALLPVWGDPLPSGADGAFYTAALGGYGGTPPYTWACPSLPPGLSLNTGSGLITGTPTTLVSSLALLPTITDSASPPVTKSKATHITIGAAGSPPPPALAAGYTVQAFGDTITLGANLFPWNFFGNVEPPGALVQNSDGSITCTGISGNTSNLDMASVYHSTVGAPPHSWKGTAFGGGAYFRARIKYPAANVSVGGLGWPAFWLLPIEHWVFGSGTQLDQWPGQAAGYEHFPEIDIMEYLNGAINKFNMAVHDHYSIYPPLLDVVINLGAVTSAVDLSQYQDYGLLWVPATSLTQGRFEWYFNNVLVGTYSYNLYNTGDAPPPVAHTTAAAIADIQHFPLLFGTHNPAMPMTVKDAGVWQASTAGNLVQ